MYENRMVPLVDLRKFYQIEGETPEKAILIYLNSGKTEGCMLVDRMYEQKELLSNVCHPYLAYTFVGIQVSVVLVLWEAGRSALHSIPRFY